MTHSYFLSKQIQDEINKINKLLELLNLDPYGKLKQNTKSV